MRTQPEPIIIDVPTHTGAGVVEILTQKAWTTPTDGLVVHPTQFDNDPGDIDEDVAWTVTHARSGCAVCGAPGPEQAMLLAEKLGEFGFDWNGTGAEVEAAVVEYQRRNNVDLFAQLNASLLGGPSASKFPNYYRR